MNGAFSDEKWIALQCELSQKSTIDERREIGRAWMEENTRLAKDRVAILCEKEYEGKTLYAAYAHNIPHRISVIDPRNTLARHIFGHRAANALFALSRSLIALVIVALGGAFGAAGVVVGGTFAYGTMACWVSLFSGRSSREGARGR